jgi:hypothetical protein
VRVSATRVTHAPRPQTETLPHGDNLDDSHRKLRNYTSDPTPKETDEPEYVMDNIVGLRILMIERGAIAFAGMAASVKMTHGNRLLTSLTT